jgi:hypothetical protein
MASTIGLSEVANACASNATPPLEDPDCGIAVGVAWGIVPNPTPFDATSVVRQTGTVRVAMSTSRGGFVTAVGLMYVVVGVRGISELSVGVGYDVGTVVGDNGSLVAVDTDC